MNATTQIQTFTHAARQCAILMMSNAQYIENELANVQLPEGMEGQLRAVCAALIGTKHDVISDLFELSEACGAGSAPEEFAGRIQRIIEWLADPLEQLGHAVQTIQAATDTDHHFFLGFILIAESAAALMSAFIAVVEAAPAAGEPITDHADLTEALQNEPQ